MSKWLWKLKQFNPLIPKKEIHIKLKKALNERLFCLASLKQNRNLVVITNICCLMRYKYYIPVLLLALTGCTSNNKEKDKAGTSTASIHKVWVFKAIKSADSVSKSTGSAWIGNNVLDLTNNDTLRFSYKINKNPPTSYLYKIVNDTLYIGNEVAYKILKITDNELELVSSFKKNNGAGNSSVMVYEVKK